MKKDYQNQIHTEKQVDALIIVSVFLTVLFVVWAILS